MDLPLRPKDPFQRDPTGEVRIILGLDWGTAFTSGVASCTTHSLAFLKRLEIRPFRRYSSASGDSKNRSETEIPTCIRYGENDVSIGIEAEQHEENGDWYSGASMVRRLKIFLDDRPEFEQQRKKFLRTLPAGKSVDDVVTDFFRILLRDWKRELVTLGCPDRAIWDLSCCIPAAWLTQKPLHRLSDAILKGARECDITIEEHIRFVPEPVAAAAYLRLDDMNFEKQMTADMVVAVCDCGGGTTDVTVCRVESLSEGVLQEITPTKGTPYGSENLDEAFEEQVRARLSSLPEVDRTTVVSGLPFLLNWFNKRTKARFTGEEDYFRLQLVNLPNDPSKDFEEHFLRMRKHHLLEIFDKVLERIWWLLEYQIKCALSQVGSVEAVILTGGFSANKYLRKYLADKLHSLSAQLALTKIELYPYSIHDYAFAKGALYCSRRDKSIVRRVNRCSVGLLQYEVWNRNLPGHPQEPPEPDPVTGELLVENCIKLLWKKGENEADPEPCRLFRSFNIEENIVGISVDLWTFKEITMDNYTIDHERNEDRQLWQSIEFKVDVSPFKHTLNVYDTEHPEPNSTLGRKPRKVRSGRKEGGDIQTPPGRIRRSTRRANQTDKGVEYAQRMTANRCKSKTSQEKTNSQNVTPKGLACTEPDPHVENSAAMEDAGDKNRRQWHTVEFVFRIKRDGELGRWTVECTDAPPDQRAKREGTARMTWVHEAGSY
ncbi:hypothetical protein PV08_07994 [Exophiala spinifera]|uniref:Uncharacterized protein n=1 Tax=Exophiala spinifera TaxID=91928 RepID=A0A0D1ZIW2_9EURO|nr:uncharacterized protein PV08_07994 [Exophiala spinifera]KIW12807.1 hypothetical protein PV08_07994 [Exophiala spinifera]